jgi:hypothetical protein
MGTIADGMPQSQEDNGAFEHSSHVLLQFPTIPVDGTPASWLSRSQIVAMTSNPDYSSFDDTSSSLGDSTYDFVDDKSGIVSDDEDHENLTQSVSSNDERDLSQVDRVPPSTIMNDGEANALPQSPLSRSVADEHSLPVGSGLRGLHARDGANDGFFIGPGHDMGHMLLLQEPSITGMDSDKPFEGELTLKVFDQSEASEVMIHHIRATSPSKTVTAVLKQTMVRQGLIPNSPYKMLYVGNPSAREEIVWKIGSALDASLTSEESSPNQYAIVRIPSFQDAAPRGVELIDSTGIGLVVEECGSASFTKMSGGNDTISMAISNQVSSDQKLIESVWSGSGHRVTDNWRLPDIAIFYLSDRDNISAKQTRHFARKFMNRHQVPCMIISQVPLWDRPAEVIALDYTTLHICLEAHDPSTSIVKRLPVDLKTFLILDAGQMNSNLAYLANRPISSRRRNPRRSASNNGSLRDPPVNEKGHYFFLNIPQVEGYLLPLPPSLKRVFLPSLFLIFGLLLYQLVMSVVVGAPYVPARLEQGADTITNIRRACAERGPTMPIPLSSHPASITKPISLKNKALLPQGKPPAASNSVLASLLHGRQHVTPNQSEDFEVGIIGDCHIVLRSPHWFIRSKKTHKLAFNVTRKGSTLHHQVSMPFDGVYALEIPRDDAYGTLNVSLWTTSKPFINKSFEVEFGTPWLKVYTWNKATQAISRSIGENRHLALAALKVQYDRFAKTLGYLGKVEAGKEAGNFPKALPYQATKTKDVILSSIGLSHNLAMKLGDGSISASKQLMSNVRKLRRSITDYSTKTSLLLSEHTQRLSQAMASNYQTIARNFVRSQNTHLRATQKNALKFWWKIRGLPTQDRFESMDRSKSHVHNDRSTRKTGR